MNYTQKQIADALHYANTNAEQPDEVTILAAEVLRLQEIESLGAVTDEATKSAFAQLRADLAAQNAEVRRLQNLCEREAAASMRNFNDAMELTEEMDKLRADLAARDAEISRLKSAIGESLRLHQEDYVSLKSRAETAEAELSSREAELNRVRQTVTSQEHQLLAINRERNEIAKLIGKELGEEPELSTWVSAALSARDKELIAIKNSDSHKSYQILMDQAVELKTLRDAMVAAQTTIAGLVKAGDGVQKLVRAYQEALNGMPQQFTLEVGGFERALHEKACECWISAWDAAKSAALALKTSKDKSGVCVIPGLSESSAEKVKFVLALVAESRERMNNYTPEQRAQLEKAGREFIAAASLKDVPKL